MTSLFDKKVLLVTPVASLISILPMSELPNRLVETRA
jgi:hypothetical protein